MKALILIGSMFLFVPSSGQKIDATKVPTAVQATFAKNFPRVNNIKWENEKGRYEANFRQNGKKMSALFRSSGSWLETETDIAVSELPVTVASYVAANYKGEKIKEVAKLKTANGDSNYEAEVKGMDLIFDTNGKFIKAQKG